MSRTAAKTDKKNMAQNVLRVHDAREVAQMPALPQQAVALVVSPGALLPMPLPEARSAISSAFAQLDAVDEEIDTLNARKSRVFKELRDLGFDIGMVRRLRKESKLDPTLRQAARDLLRIYWTLLADDQPFPADLTEESAA